MAYQASLIGIDLGATWVRLCRVGASSSDLFKLLTPSGPDAHALSRELQRLLRRIGGDAPIGISRAPGLDGSGRVSSWPSRPDWIGVPLLPTIAEVARVTPRSADDGVCAAIWEHRAHRFPVQSTTACLTLGTGLGVGIIRNGTPVSTGDGAGTIGHLPLGDPGLVCVCGKTACLQATLSTLSSGRLRRESRGSTRALVDRTLKGVWSYLRAHYGVEQIVLTGGALERSLGADAWPLSELAAASGDGDQPRFHLSSTPALSALGGALLLAADETADPQVTIRIGRALQRWQLLTSAFEPAIPSCEPRSSTTTCAVRA